MGLYHVRLQKGEDGKQYYDFNHNGMKGQILADVANIGTVKDEVVTFDSDGEAWNETAECWDSTGNPITTEVDRPAIKDQDTAVITVMAHLNANVFKTVAYTDHECTKRGLTKADYEIFDDELKAVKTGETIGLRDQRDKEIVKLPGGIVMVKKTSPKLGLKKDAVILSAVEL